MTYLISIAISGASMSPLIGAPTPPNCRQLDRLLGFQQRLQGGDIAFTLAVGAGGEGRRRVQLQAAVASEDGDAVVAAGVDADQDPRSFLSAPARQAWPCPPLSG
jgi:hypothetical protein